MGTLKIKYHIIDLCHLFCQVVKASSQEGKIVQNELLIVSTIAAEATDDTVGFSHQEAPENGL